MKKALKSLDIKAVARKIRWPTNDWHGQCYAVSCEIVKAKIVKGRAVYGHYYGPVAETGYWANRRGQMFQRHGWIVLEDGRFLDPTCWSFEDKNPYLCFHDCEDHEGESCYYDEGGNGFRALTMRPMPQYREPGPKADQYERNHLKHIKLKLKGKAKTFVFGLLDYPPAITWEMVHWLANLNPNQFDGHTKEVFQSIVDADEAVLIPVDNRRMVLGK
jgi:hypothetical protein